MPSKFILAGGTGFIGAALGRRLRERGAEVVVLTRHQSRSRSDGIREVSWDGRGPGSWSGELEGATAVVNLAGASINRVHTPENQRLILDSRVESVRALGAAMRRMTTPPAAWIQGCAVGIYGNRGLEKCDEAASAGTGFIADVCRQWEATFAEECPRSVRPVVIRTGIVLGRKGGAYPALARLARCYLGGAAGDGKQGMSWITLPDIVEIFAQACSEERFRGIYNGCAPEPVSNAEFMRRLRASLGRPWAPSAPAPLVRLSTRWLLRTDPSLALEGQYVVPARLEAEGHRFQTPRLLTALTGLAQK